MTATSTLIRRPLLDAAVPTLAAHRALLGPLPALDAASIRAFVDAAGLIGRGGAGFPTARKLAAVAASSASVVVANGAEGEPASGKDRALLMTAPHLVLDGLQLACRAVGARSAYLYAPEPLLAGVLGRALRERDDRVPVTAVAAPDAFLSGEESAVVAAVSGRRAVPTATPPRVFERGVRGLPTLVQNVETLAAIGLIVRFGPQWFREQGGPSDPGSRLVTVSGAVASPGVYEVPGGCALSSVVAAAGGLSEPVSALLIGGYHGAWVPASALDTDVALSRDSLALFGAAPGAGVVVALSARVCGLRAGAGIAGYLSDQGARQCGPCRNGLPTMAATLHRLANGPVTPELPAEVERVAALVAGRGACHHPDGTVRMVRSTLAMFRHEVAAHLGGRCTAPGRAPLVGRVAR